MDVDNPEQPTEAGNPARSRSDDQTDEDLPLLVDSAPDLALIVTDTQLNVIRWSAGAERMTGWTAAEAVGQSLRGLLYPPEEKPGASPDSDPEWDAAMRDGRTDAEHWLVKKDGTRFWGACVTTPLYDRQTGALRGFGKVLRDLTVQKRLEEEMRGLLEESLDTVLILSDAAAVGESGAPVSAQVSLGKENPGGRRLFDLFPAAGDPHAGTHWHDVLSHLDQDGSLRIGLPDGRTMEARYRARTNLVPESHLPALRQATRRRRAEQALRTSKDHLAAIFARAAVGLSEIGLDGRFLQVNDELCRILARSRDELLASSIPSVTHPHDLPASIAALATTIETGGPVSLDKRYLRPDGATVWANSSLTLLRDHRGAPRALLAVTVDLSQRRQQEEELRALFEESLDALLIAGDDAVLVDANPAATILFGLQRDEIVGRKLFDLFPSESHERAAAMWDDFLSRGHQEGMVRLLRRDGSLVEVDYRARAHYVPGRHLSVLRDVTERWQAEQALRASEQALREANETLETRVAERTRVLQEQTAELARMNEMRQELLQRLVNTEEQERRRISRELHDQTGQHLTGLVLGLKSLEDTVHAAGLLDPESNNLLLTLRTIADELARDVHRIAVELRPTALDDLGLVPALRSLVERWSLSHHIRAEFDSFGIEDGRHLPEMAEITIYRVVQEALTNVAKYAADGPHKATKVGVTLQLIGEQVQATIEDDGPGFDREAADRSDRSGHLGVAGMRERAAWCGGMLDIESVPGSGTTVLLRIPVALP
jgi:PAS domain S-box-containing protein